MIDLSNTAQLVPPTLAAVVPETRIRRWRAADRLLSLPPDRQVLRCGDIAWLYPQPTDEWYEEFYRDRYHSYQEHLLSGDRQTRRRLTYFGARLSRIEAQLGFKPRAILEIGAGDGLFLVAAREADIPAVGLDISAAACRMAEARHRVRMIPGRFLQADLPLQESYDAIVMNHVFEHLTDPLEHLARVRAKLSRDGLLVIEIPQQFLNPIDLLYRAAGFRRPFSPYSLHHPVFYTVSSITRMLEEAGFRVEHLTTWLPRQVFHTQNPWITAPLQALLWIADRVARRGHIIEIFARPAGTHRAPVRIGLAQDAGRPAQRSAKGRGRPIHVVHVIAGLERGGAEVNLTQLVTNLDPERFRSTVVSLTGDGALGADLRSAGFPLHTLGLRRGSVDLRGLGRLTKLLRELNPDLVQGWMYHANLLGLLAGGLVRRLPTVWNVRCSNMDFSHYSRVTKTVVSGLAWLAHMPQAVVVNSQIGIKLHESIGYRPRRWVLIPNGFNTEKFQPDQAAPERLRATLKIRPDAVVIGQVARNDPMKDYANLLTAAAAVSAKVPWAQFVLAGAGTENLSPLVEKLGLAERVHLLGERGDIASLMPGLDFLCLSSAFGEGFSNVLGEALACGVPCVATDVGDAAEIVGESGRIVPPRDSKALATAMIELINVGAQQRAALGRAGRQRIIENYSLRSIVARYEDLYAGIAARAHGGH